MNNIRYMYIRDEKRNPIGVIVTRKVENYVEVNYSFCSPKDKFDKKIGKKIALGRLETKPAFVCGLDEKSNRHSITRDVLASISYVVNLTKKTEKFVQNWLRTHQESL